MTIVRMLVVAALGASAIATAAPAAAELKSLTIGTNPAGTVFHLLGGGIAKLYQEKLKIRSTAQPNGGTSVYVPLIDNGEMTMGIVSSLETSLARRGAAPFTKPMRDVRAMARIWVIPYSFLVRGDSSIRTVEDLKGKRVLGEMPTNVSLTMLNKAILKTGGLEPKDVEFLKSGGLIKGIDAVVEGRADASSVATAVPVLLKAHASVTGGLRIVSLGKQASDEMLASLVPGARVITQNSSKQRPYVPDNTRVAAYDAFLNLAAKVSDDDAYRLVKTLHENYPALQKSYPPMRSVKADAIAPPTNTIPYHAGVVRYLKEKGMWSAAHEANEKALAAN